MQGNLHNPSRDTSRQNPHRGNLPSPNENSVGCLTPCKQVTIKNIPFNEENSMVLRPQPQPTDNLRH